MFEWALVATFLAVGGWAAFGWMCNKYKPWTEFGKKIEDFIRREKAKLV